MKWAKGRHFISAVDRTRGRRAGYLVAVTSKLHDLGPFIRTVIVFDGQSHPVPRNMFFELEYLSISVVGQRG